MAQAAGGWQGLGAGVGLALIGAVVALGAILLQGLGPRGDSAVIDGGLALSSGAATVAFLWRQRSASNPGPWRILAVAGASTTLGNLANLVRHAVLGRLASDVGFSEVFFLLGYGAFLLAFVRFFPPTANRRDAVRRVVDALALTVILTAILWLAVLHEIVLGSGADLWGSAIVVMYPGLDLAIAAVLLSLASELRGAARDRILCMALGMALFMVGDLGLAVQTADTARVDLSSLSWMAGYFAFALAGILRVGERPESWQPATNGRLATLLVYAPVAVLLPLAMVDYLEHRVMDPVLFGLGVAMVACLSARQVLLAWDLGSANQRLGRSERRLSGILDSQSALVVRVSPENRITYMNEAYQRAFGLKVGDAFWVKVHPDDRAATQAALEQLAKPPYTCAVEQRAEVHGEWRTFYWQDSVVQDDEGNVTEVQGVGFDVTDLRQAQEQLAAQHRLFEEMQAVAHVGSWEIDLLTGHQQGSEENRRLFNLAPGEAETTENILAHIHPDDHGKVQEAMAAMASGRQAQLDLRIVLPDGGIRWLSSQGEGRLEDGRPARIVGLSQDITARKAAESELRESEERFRLAALATHDVIWEWDLATDRLFYSPALRTVFGLDPSAMARQHQFVRHVHPDDLRDMEARLGGLMAGTATEVTSEYRLRREDDTYSTVVDRVHIVRDADGKALRLVGAMQDVSTERRAAAALLAREALLGQAEELADMSSWEADLVTYRSTWSPGAFKLFGLDPSTPMTFDSWLSCLHPEDRAYAQAMADSVVTTMKPTEFECRIIRKSDGQVRHTFNRTVPTLEAGKVVRLTGINQDITAAREAQRSEAEVKRLQDVAAFKTQFLNNAAHELATPLTPIRLQMASLKRAIYGELTPKQADAIGLIDRNLERLNVLVADLLDAARLQSGRLKVMARPLAPGPLASDVLASFAEKARDQGITLAARGLESRLEVLGDDARLNQVLFNLVHNALKFTPRGGRIELALARDGDSAVITVRDSGIGLKPDQVARLFQPFTQVHDTVQNNVGGTGLGLYISRGILEQHGGTLACRSDGPGKGATFEVRIPLLTASAEAVASRGGKAASGPDPGPRAPA